MDIPLDNFTGAKLTKAYNNVETVNESGIYFHSADLTFDIIHVAIRHTGEVASRTVITKIPEIMAFDDTKKVWAAALQQLEAFQRRISAKAGKLQERVDVLA